MDTRQAFDLITKATGLVVANRQDHFNIQIALQVIEDKLFPKTEPKPEIKEEKK